MISRLPPGSTSAVLLFLLLLTPLRGLAAEDAPLAVQTGEHMPSLLEDPDSGSQRRRAPLALRLLAEVGGGVVTTVAGGFTGLGLCLLSQPATLSESGCAYPFLFGLMAGLVVGYPLGVWWGGEAVGGDGRLWASLGGGVVGLLAGGVLEISTDGSGMAAAIPVLGMIGASLGYELSQRPEHPERTAASPRIQPMLAFDTRGGVFGLSGRF